MAAVPNINVEMISKEMIKPSSPTPNHLRNFKLSFIDQFIAPSSCMPFIFFYDHHKNNESSSPTTVLTDTDRSEICRRLKQSLSYILTIYYPLAGRLVPEGNSSSISIVDCNDEGALFVKARCSALLVEVIEDPKWEQLLQFFPVHPFEPTEEAVLFSVKISFFDCSGFSIGVCMSHKIADANSFALLMKAWAAANCEDSAEKKDFGRPSFELADLFPLPSGLPVASIETMGMNFSTDKIMTKRLIFGKEKIEKLKREIINAAVASRGGGLKDPTRVEAVSAFLWQRFIQAAKAKSVTETSTLFAASHMVNLRPKTNPPLSEHSFGNCLSSATAVVDEFYEDKISSSAAGRSVLANKLRVATRKIDEEYIKKFENGAGEYLNDFFSKITELYGRGVQYCNFSSLCRAPVYEVDFGLGKPVWVCISTFPVRNMVVLASTREGEGIEAWLNLAEDDKEMFEEDDN